MGDRRGGGREIAEMDSGDGQRIWRPKLTEHGQGHDILGYSLRLCGRIAPLCTDRGDRRNAKWSSYDTDTDVSTAAGPVAPASKWKVYIDVATAQVKQSTNCSHLDLSHASLLLLFFKKSLTLKKNIQQL